MFSVKKMYIIYMEEIWISLDRFDGNYAVSNLGNVWSKPRQGSKGGYLTPVICQNNGGYSMINMNYNHHHYTFQLSHLVWEAFNGPVPEGMEINHIDENKQNNALSNLEICDRTYNCRWGTRSERIAKKHSKAIVQYTLDGEYIAEYPSMRELERQKGYKISSISLCCNNKKDTAYGYKWKFKEKGGA